MSKYNYCFAKTTLVILLLFFSIISAADPYKATAAGDNDPFSPGYQHPVPPASITTTSFDRPSEISLDGENSYVSYVYNAGGERAKATMDDAGFGVRMNRWYLGGVYEKDENSGTSITEVLTTEGDIVEQYRYDPWGIQLNGNIDTCAVDIVVADSLITPEMWMRAGLSVYVGSHGYTGHEHIYGTGLINCNARLYDPVIGCFLAPDPLIQDPASTQNFNRYSYCLNNPLKYTDESGEYAFLDDVLAGFIGGVLNWVSNGHAFTRQGLTYFVVGFGGGVASLYVSPVGGAAAVSAANSVVRQGFDESGNHWNGSNINPFTVAYDGIVGAVTSWLGGALTSQVSSWIGSFTDLIPGKAFAQMLNRSLSSGVVALGTNAISAYGVSREGDLEYWEAFSAGMDNVWQAMAIGALTGTAEGIRQAREVGENPWSGKTVQEGFSNSSSYTYIPSDDSMIVTPQGVVLPPGVSIPAEYLQNPARYGSYGYYDSQGKFIEKLRIDPPTPQGKKGPNVSHYHINGKKKHYFNLKKWPK